MSYWIDKLTEVASLPIISTPPILSSEMEDLAGHLSEELKKFLSAKNGFYAFESALHVFPASSLARQDQLTLGQWNDLGLWRSSYGELANGSLFFAEDIFGVQFCINNDRVYTFDPETAEKQEMANDLESWAQIIMADYDVLTGFPLAHEWQLHYGPLPSNQRLVPKKMFVMGGDFSIENLYALDSIKGMHLRGSIAMQIQNIPDGDQVRIRIN